MKKCKIQWFVQSWKLWKEGTALKLIDTTIKDSLQTSEVLRCIHVGQLCVQQRPDDRSNMLPYVVLMLSSETVSLPQPNQPGFYNERSLVEVDSSSSRKMFSSNEITFTSIQGITVALKQTRRKNGAKSMIVSKEVTTKFERKRMPESTPLQDDSDQEILSSVLKSLWQAYLAVNKIFADRVMEVINPEYDFVWVHDYHLMVLPTFLRKKFNRVYLGFFLHSPFPSSKIYKTFPVREHLLRALLNADLIGFHTFDYARHFLSCCSQMLGLSYESKRGYIGLEYYGRTVNIKILPVGIHMGQLQSILSLLQTKSKISELMKKLGIKGG
ncbi:hypothetical protein GIB67_026411 [Kingdonia uniflora]|uniref:S-locus receptor kinase C-terminal domain-containing protein n=1 Tax=Kingdonia uniflora TaxID=39325 RepID=A0A7J7P6H9_9MAGN|nr:hypothetical protein GIB67_026411 [Kingdonia uniflora]